MKLEILIISLQAYLYLKRFSNGLVQRILRNLWLPENGMEENNSIKLMPISKLRAISLLSMHTVMFNALKTGSMIWKVTLQIILEFNRPVVCTEYMARLANSKFITHLPIFKETQVWAINWGFVFGRTQTYYPWGSKEGSPVPAIWFHDVVHPDGTPFDSAETNFIRNITKVWIKTNSWYIYLV